MILLHISYFTVSEQWIPGLHAGFATPQVFRFKRENNDENLVNGQNGRERAVETDSFTLLPA